MLTVIMIFLGIAVLLLFDGVLENYFPTTKEYSIQSPKIKEEKKVKEVPVIMRERAGGVSSISPMKSIYYMIKVTLAILIEKIR